MTTHENIPLYVRDSGLIQKAHILITIFWTIIIIVFAGFAVKWEKDKGINLTLDNARAYFQMVVTTRLWNAERGGIYCPINEKTQPNPWLDVPNRDVTTLDGQKLTLINPAYMTRQLSEIASKKNKTLFHITSLKPIRPQNAADSWEKKALKSFTREHDEYWELIFPGNKHEYFRYMAPLWTEQPCLKCHAKQGYKKGDLRGGISVAIPVDDLMSALNSTGIKFILIFFGIWFMGTAGIFISYRIVSRSYGRQSTLINKLEKSLEEVKTLKGFIPICSSCKKIRNDGGYWEQIEKYISERSDAEFSHGICPDCMEKLYPEYAEEIKKKKMKKENEKGE
ncbi:MAG: DUF3365 domain-containing protein [Deltaproteobacteria bacterium]|nr:DUF3365 domain-containing protein [Deltaproteobacteria bacterium]